MAMKQAPQMQIKARRLCDCVPGTRSKRRVFCVYDYHGVFHGRFWRMRDAMTAIDSRASS